MLFTEAVPSFSLRDIHDMKKYKRRQKRFRDLIDIAIPFMGIKYINNWGNSKGGNHFRFY